MLKTTVITVDDPAWEEVISQCRVYDFYHTRSYHLLETLETELEAVLFVCEEGADFVAMPIVIRSIPGTPYFDCTSVYGYVGPVSNQAFETMAASLQRYFVASIRDYFASKQIIATFSRLHPLVDTRSFFNDFGSIIDLNKTVAIDTQLTPEEQWRNFRKSNKSEINQLRKKKGYTVKTLTSEEELVEFVSIYNKTMQRVNAGDYYYFDLAYFKTMLRSSDFDAKILLAMKDETIAAGAVFTMTGQFMQYHLAGTSEPYMFDTPMKLILDEARLLANSLSLDFLHLGGGVGGSDEDSLFRFKSGFSKHYFQFSTWQYIVNTEVYKELVASNGVFESTYFPLYRAPKN